LDLLPYGLRAGELADLGTAWAGGAGNTAKDVSDTPEALLAGAGQDAISLDPAEWAPASQLRAPAALHPAFTLNLKENGDVHPISSPGNSPNGSQVNTLKPAAESADPMTFTMENGRQTPQKAGAHEAGGDATSLGARLTARGGELGSDHKKEAFERPAEPSRGHYTQPDISGSSPSESRRGGGGDSGPARIPAQEGPGRVSVPENELGRPSNPGRIQIRLQAGSSAPLNIRIVESANRVRVAVHSSDRSVSEQLRASLPELMQRLANSGYSPDTSATERLPSGEFRTADSEPNSAGGDPEGWHQSGSGGRQRNSGGEDHFFLPDSEDEEEVAWT
jgi:hypothetical protein